MTVAFLIVAAIAAGALVGVASALHLIADEMRLARRRQPRKSSVPE